MVDGSMSRTSAADGAGAKTQMVSLIAAVAIPITAVALTGLFYSLPEATLGAIVIHAVWHNINFKKITQYRAYTRLDYVTAIAALIGVLALGLLEGLVIAAAQAIPGNTGQLVCLVKEASADAGDRHLCWLWPIFPC